MSEKIACVAVSIIGDSELNSYILPISKFDIKDLCLEDGDEGDGYSLRLKYMTQEELDALPEFMGF